MNKSILYLINVDWFFVSHFLHLARRAREDGYEVAVATRLESRRERLASEGFRLIDLPARRAGVLPSAMGRTISLISEELAARRGAILHGFGKFGIVAGTLASRKAGHADRVFTITGRGYAAARSGPGMRLVGASFREFCRRYADGPRTRWLAENSADLEATGLAQAACEGRAAIVGGAGVDPVMFAPAPLPSRPPLRAALVSRMIWSKGVDIAVEAVTRARSQGHDVELTLAGLPDPANPRSLAPDELARFGRYAGVQWRGRVHDVPALWREQHIAILPSRGGEGVPKSLIEAAACGRPIVTTDVPGCAELAAKSGGWIVPPEDPAALSRALGEAATSNLEQRAETARAAVLASYTEQANWNQTCNLYLALEDERPCLVG
jgi:glycosyltransferase involved in cell wall biosynthesis